MEIKFNVNNILDVENAINTLSILRQCFTPVNDKHIEPIEEKVLVTAPEPTPEPSPEPSPEPAVEKTAEPVEEMSITQKAAYDRVVACKTLTDLEIVESQINKGSKLKDIEKVALLEHVNRIRKELSNVK